MKDTIKKKNKNQKYEVRRGICPLWSTTNISIGISWIIVGYVTYFCTNFLGLNAAIVGGILLASKIIDAITNFVCAYIVDNCHFKMGKGRPFQMASIIPMWVCIVLMYMIPAEWSMIAKYILVFVIYNMINAVFATIIGCTDLMYFNHAIKDEQLRVSVQTFNGMAQMVATSVIGIFMPVLVASFEHQPNGWIILAMIVSVPSALLGMVRVITIKEVDTEETSTVQERITIKDTFQGLFSNKYVIITAFMYFVINVINQFNGTGATYYFTYIVGDLSKQSVINVFSIVSAISLIVYIPLSRKLGKIGVLKISFIIAIIGCILRFLAGDNMIILIVSSLLSTQVTYPFMAFGGLLLIDSMDYGEWKNHKRLEGAIFAGYSLGSTIGGGVGSSLVGLVLGVSHFDGMQVVQRASALFGIKCMYGLLPAILLFVVFVMLKFYDLEEKMPQIKKELEERKAVNM